MRYFRSWLNRNPTLSRPDLADFLRTRERACLLAPTDQGTILVVKLPDKDIVTLSGRFPIHFRAALYDHPSAPVIRLLTTFYDRPQNPLRLESFINIAEEDQRRDFAALSQQQEFYMLFYDQHLAHRLTKGVNGLDQEQLQRILDQAHQLRSRIPPHLYDFDRAKDTIILTTPL